MPAAPAIPVDAQLAGDDPEGIAAFARAAEEAGVGRLWAPELHRSATVPLALAAAGTRRIGIGTGIALAFTRSPMTLALESLDLDELSGGRLALGLGAGVRRLNNDWHAAPYDPPLRRMREMVAAVRELVGALAEGRDARSEGRVYDVRVTGLRRPHAAPRAEIPVWLAAVRGGMTRLAGEVADGFLSHPVTTPEWLRDRLLPELDAGAARAGRPRPTVSGAAICAPSDGDPAEALRAGALTVGFYATVRTYEELFSEHGYAERLPGIRRAFLSGDADRLADAVGDDMTRRFAAVGTAEEVAARLSAHEGIADRVWATPPHHLQPPSAARRWQEGILRVARRGREPGGGGVDPGA